VIEAENNFGRSVIDQTYRRMVEDISSGKFQPGDRMPGDRELAKEYGIGRSSMIRVLARLKEERYIERIPVYGTFVRSDLLSRHQVVSLAFATPDMSLSPEHIGLFGWGNIMEMLRGIFEECSARPGVRATLLYCQDTADLRKLRAQLEDLRRFDGVIFCGHLMQPLKRRFAAEAKPAVVVAPKPREFPEIYPMVYFEPHDSLIEMAHYVMEQALGRRIVLLHRQPHKVDSRQSRDEVRIVMEELERHGAAYEEIYIDRPVTGDAEALSALEPIFRERKRFAGKVVWCLNRKMLPVLNHLMQKHQTGAPLFGSTSGVAQAGIFPPVPYLQEPFYEVGRTAVRMLADNICSGKPVGNRILKPTLCRGSVPLQNKIQNRRKSS